MRLQLTIGALLLSTLSPGDAAPVAESGARFDTYADDWITVYSPAARTRAELTDGLEVDARYAMDALSGATQVLLVDGTTSATRFSEERHEGRVEARYRPDPLWSVAADYAVSVEPDDLTHRFGAEAVAEVLDRMATLTLSWHTSLRTMGRTDDPTLAEDTLTHALDLGWSQLLGRRTRLGLRATGEIDTCDPGHGCQASPYRFVALLGSTGVRMVVSERHPDERLRGALGARLVQGLGGGLALHGGYRFYADSWHVIAHTADAAAVKTFLAERLALTAEGRFTWQTAASFYRDDYPLDASPARRTADRELAGVTDGLVGLRFEASWPDLGPLWRLTLNARASRHWYRYRDFTELPRRDAWLLGLGALASY